MELKDRIIKFIESENITPSVFADKIGVQRSSISHILSGRNNPSYEFILKILNHYQNLNAEWLLTGTGDIYKTIPITNPKVNLFEHESNPSEKRLPEVKSATPTSEQSEQPSLQSIAEKGSEPEQNKRIDKIIIFYADKTFSQYFPEH